MTRYLHTAIALVLLVVLATPARAATPEDQAAAEALFQEAVKLAKAGNFAAACPKLAESQRLDPAGGTLLNLGACYENIGKLASAWAAFTEASVVSRGKNEERAKEAARRAALVEPRLPKLSIVVPPAVKVDGLRVTRDGEAVGDAQFGSAIPVDAGEHVIAASAPGRLPWSKRVTVAGLGVVSVEVEPLAPGPVEVKPGEAPASPYWNGQRAAGVVIGGPGLVGIVVGSYFGVQGANKNNASMAYCPTVQTMCYAPGVSLRNDAYSAATASTIAFVASGIAVGAGAGVFFTATKATPKAIGVAVGPRSVTIAGSW